MERARDGRPGWGLLIGYMVVLAFLALIPVVVGWNNIPDPFAGHWGVLGEPDGYFPKWSLPLLPLGLIGLGGLVAGMFRSKVGPSAEGVAILTLLGSMAILTTVLTVSLNWGADDWTAASPISWMHLVGLLTAPISLAYAGFKLGSRLYPPVIEDSDSRTPALIEVAPGEQAAWIGFCRVRYPYFIAAGAAVFLVLSPPAWRLFALPFLLLALVLSYVRVSVSDYGLRAKLGGIMWRNIPLEQVARAEFIDLNPAEWGGWGYRMFPGRSAMVLRRGEAIEVHLKSGRRFAVTVDDAARGAGLLNGLLARAL
jgi:hypothetical protein